MQGNLPKACCRTPREVDAAADVHICFFSKGVFRDALKTIGITAGVIVAVGAVVTAICLAVKKKNKPDAEIPYPASAWDTK